MAQYLISVWHTGGYPTPPEAEMLAAFERVDAFNAELEQAGALVFAGGLQPAATAAVVRATDGDTHVTEGPYADGDQHMGGFWVVEAPSPEAARAIAARGAAACGDAVEVRPFQVEPEG